ncbi:MAG: hypothetical protein Q8R02_00895 [Hyphomonadaceae bacterium]|nr:hypothetical protein [Hyphomonadaceae bacterium]
MTWMRHAQRHLQAIALCVLLPCAIAPENFLLASGQTPQQAPSQSNFDQSRGVTFGCQDGSQLVLAFEGNEAVLSAVVSVHGVIYRLPVQPREPGPVQIVWSDGAHSLSWSSGVRLMWMGEAIHLMCGRSHKH